jgi:hypothetical protein
LAHKKSIMRSLGEFFGHVTKAVKAPVDAPTRSNSNPPARDQSSRNQAAPPIQAAPAEVRRSVEERVAETPGGKVVLRRTVIDEVVRNDTP